MNERLQRATSTSVMKRALLVSASIGALAAIGPAQASALLSFDTTGSLSGWTTYGTVTTTNTTVNLSLGGTPFSLTPATGEYMASIQPSGNSVMAANADSILGLSAGTLNSVMSGLSGGNKATNFGVLTETVSLAAGTYTFYWSYAAQDYKPYNDGVLFALSGGGLNTLSVLASNGPDGAQGSTVVVGSYGATQWAPYSFTLASSGTYQVSFAAYNWQDTSVNPILYVGTSAGTVTSTTPIDTAAPYYLASNIGSTVNPDFKGGTLRVDTSTISSAFTVEAYSGNKIDAFGNTGTFSGVMSGAGGLTITDSLGGGKVIFTATNTYSGGTTVSSGATLQIGNGGTSGSVVGNIADNGTLTFNRSNAVTYAGVISGAGSLTQAGSGTLVLTGANTYSGGSTISAGTLQIGNGGTSGSIAGNVTNNATLAFNRSDAVSFAGMISGTGSLAQLGSGTLTLTGANTYSGGTTISAGTLQIGDGGTAGSITGDITNNGSLAFNRSDAATYAGVISGTGSLVQLGSGTLTLTGANTYSGGTIISVGTLQIGDGNTSGSIAGDVANNGALAFNRSDAVTYAGVISGTGGLVQLSAGTLTLTGANTYTGGTTVSAGTLQIGDGNTSGSIAGDVTTNGILAFNRSDAITYAGVISGTGSLVQLGAGTLTLTGANTYTGGTTISAGTLQIGDGGTNGSISGGITNNGMLAFNHSDDIAYGDPISGTGSLVKLGTGTLTLTGANSYTGATTVSAGTLQIGNGGTTGWVAGPIIDNGAVSFNRSDDIAYLSTISGTGSLTKLGAGTLTLTGNNTYSGGTTITAGTLQIGNGGTTGSITGNVTNNGMLAFNRSDDISYGGVVSASGSLVKLGPGKLILTGANTYTGGTTISAGTLQIGSGGTTGSITGNITNNGMLAFNRSDAVTYAGVISGSGGLVKQGSGTLALTAANTYSGGTTISAGTLQIGNGGTTGSVAGNITNNGTLAFNRSNSISYSNAISGSGGVSVSGGGTVVFTGSNTYTGQTSIAAGSTLQIGNGGTTGSIISDVANQGVLAFNRSDTVIFNGTVSGDGTLVQNGTGTVIITTNYTGKTLVTSGTLQIGNGSAVGTVTGNIVDNSTLIYGQAAATSYTGVISGSGGVSVSGGGVVILDGANTYTGPTSVTAGSLIVGDNTHPSASIASGVTVSNNAIVGGYGTIGGNLVANGGVVSPGNSIGTLTVNGNYTQSSAATLKIEVTPTANDKLVVGGTAQLGGTLAVSLAQGTYGTNVFTLLTAGTVNGTFSTVTYSGATSDMVYGILYKPQEVDLAMTPASSGQIYGDLVTSSLDTAVTLNRTVLDRLDTESSTGWSVWSKALAGASHTAGTDTLASFNSQLWGVISGVDYQLAGGTKLSGIFSYSHTQLGVHGENDKASVNGYFFALAGHIPANSITIDVTGFVQHNDIDVVRDNGGVGNAWGQTSNLVGGGSIEVAYPVDGGDVLPFARLTVASVDPDAFTEAGTLGLSVSALKRTSVRGSFGIKLSHDFTTENGTLIRPHFLIGMENEFGQSSRDTAMTFANTAFTAPAPTPSDFSALLGAGVSAHLAQRLDFSLEASGRLSANQQEGIISFGAKYRF